MLYVLISACLIVFSGFAHFFPRYYVSELFLSFSPYWIGIFFCWLVLSLIFLRRYMRRKPEMELLPWYFKLSGLFSLCFALLFFVYAHQFSSFYLPTPAPLSASGSTITVLFANIHKNNEQYSGLEQLIIKTNPDVLLFVEFADHHYEHLKTFLKARYPYINSTTWSKQFIGSMVFSKQKVENRADNFPQWMWRYGYFSLSLNDRPYYFYLIHTSSPDSYAHFLMRNNQIASFDKDFALHALQRRSWSSVVVVGDFNTTPWSASYTDIDRVFSGTLVNMSKYLPFLRTWRLFEAPFVQAHIDHIWANSGLVQWLSVLPVPGSDHLAYLFQVRY